MSHDKSPDVNNRGGSGFYPPKKGNSFGEKHPHLICEWNDEDISPFDIGAGSNFKVKWKCQVCEHEWTGQISNISQGKGCSFCGGNVVHSDGRNSLETMASHLVEEWNEPDLQPSRYMFGSGKKVAWKCKTCAHEWNAVIASRTTNNRGCPACVGQAVHNDLRNSLGTLRPEIAKDWNHPEKSVHEFTVRSGKKVPWKCHVCQHQWEAYISNRAKGVGCPYCNSNSLHSDGRNALINTHPEISEELDDSRYSPEMLTAGFDKKVRWKCKICDDSWKTSIYERAHSDSGCPVCFGHAIHSTGRNSFAAEYPELLVEWTDVKINPSEIRAKSNKRVKWKCSKCAHTWNTSVNNRTGEAGTGCPSCAEYGFQPDKQGHYYAMEIRGSDGHWWWKGGITSNVEQRRYQLETSLKSNNMPLEVKVIEFITFEKGKFAKELENKLLAIDSIRIKVIEKFDGSKELFSLNPIQYARENALLIPKELIQTRIENWTG
jgi:Zn finger protein HypA/HybF involved in hydrogenase expression